MSFLYKLGVRAYAFGAHILALFSPKAKARVVGARDTLENLPKTASGQDCYWMHCASVGEFEQGRPLWDRMMKQQPKARFVLSFFSPSGYEVFSTKGDVGEVVYLPWDVGTNACEFIAQLSPKLAVFVKYEWWLGYFEALSIQQISSIVISAAFRQNQPFFRSNLLQSDYRKALQAVDQIFVQDQSSGDLLQGIGQRNFTISGDTRIDRTLSKREMPLGHELLTSWATEATYVMVAGSTWMPDVKLLAEALNQHQALKLIIAPHEVDRSSINQTIETLLNGCPRVAISCLSELDYSDGSYTSSDFRVVLVDSIGLLSKLYRLGHIAYIGGGFGAGIHNTLEAVAYGIPLAFGPRHAKFQEAIAIVEQKIATVVANAEDLSTFVDKYSDATSRKKVLAKAEKYIDQNRGATQRIWDYMIERKLI